MFASINTSSGCSNVWEKKAAAFKVNGSVAINSFLRRLILSRLNPFLLLTKDIVYPIYNAILFSWELNLYHFSSVGDSWAKSVICRCSKGYLSNLCWQLTMVLSGQIHLWPSPKSAKWRFVFMLWSRSTCDGKKGGKEGTFVLTASHLCQSFFCCQHFVLERVVPLPTLKVSSLCWILPHTDPPSLLFSSGTPYQKTTKSTWNSATMLTLLIDNDVFIFIYLYCLPNFLFPPSINFQTFE